MDVIEQRCVVDGLDTKIQGGEKRKKCFHVIQIWFFYFLLLHLDSTNSLPRNVKRTRSETEVS